MSIKFDDGFACRYICDSPCDAYLDQDHTNTRDFELSTCVSCSNRICTGALPEVDFCER